MSKKEVRKRGPGRPRKKRAPFDFNDPETWPTDITKRRIKELYWWDILYGTQLKDSPKARYLKSRQWREDSGRTRRYYLEDEMVESIADIQAMFKMGMLRHVPLSVVEHAITLTPGYQRKPFDLELIKSKRPDARPWTDEIIIQMALNIMRLYLMACDPFSRNFVAGALQAGHYSVSSQRNWNDPPSLKRIANSMEQAGAFLDSIEYESDDDFDFSDLVDEF